MKEHLRDGQDPGFPSLQLSVFLMLQLIFEKSEANGSKNPKILLVVHTLPYYFLFLIQSSGDVLKTPVFTQRYFKMTCHTTVLLEPNKHSLSNTETIVGPLLV